MTSASSKNSQKFGWTGARWEGEEGAGGQRSRSEREAGARSCDAEAVGRGKARVGGRPRDAGGPGWRDVARALRAAGRRRPSEAKRGPQMDHPSELLEEAIPARTLISAQRNLCWTSALQNCDLINWYGLKTSSL